MATGGRRDQINSQLFMSTSVSMQFSWAAVLLAADHLSNLINIVEFIQLGYSNFSGMRTDKEIMC